MSCRAEYQFMVGQYHLFGTMSCTYYRLLTPWTYSNFKAVVSIFHDSLLNNHVDSDIIVWFLQIFVGLHKLLGKSVPVGADDLSLTILKFIKDDSHNEAMIECHSKLNVALGVMHECFEPIKEPRTKRDLVEDVIFSKG